MSVRNLNRLVHPASVAIVGASDQPYAAGVTDGLAILPYPSALEERVQWLETTITVRPCKAEDERLYASFLSALTPDDICQRFRGMISALTHHDPARMAQLDHGREMALIAVRRNAGGVEQMLGEARSAIDPGNEVADFAIIVRSDVKQRGLGTLLLSSLIHYQRGRGTRQLCGTVMADNAAMLEMARHCGFTAEPQGIGGEVRVRLALASPPESTPAH